MIVTIAQAITYARNAGFTGDSVYTIVAIAMCESGLDTLIRGRVDPRDRGILQINSFWHPEVPDSCAFNAQCSFDAAFRISSRGSNFTQWNTYPGCSNTKISQVKSVANTTSVPSGSSPKVSIPEYTKPFMALSVSQAESRFNHFPTSPEGWVEGGVDWTPTVKGTPITALLDGVIVGAGYFCKNPDNFFASSVSSCGGATRGYGVVTIRSNNPRQDIVPGQQIDIYYQHIVIANNIKLTNTGSKGQSVKQGDVIGYSNPEFNIEVGINVGTSWGGIWGGKSPGPHVDPIPYLNAIISTGVNAGGGSPDLTGIISGLFAGTFQVQTVTQKVHTVSGQAHTLINTVPGFTGICEALDMVEQFQPFQLQTQAQSDVAVATQNADITIWSWDTGVPNPIKMAQSATAATKLPADAFQAVLVFVTTNFLAFAVRSTFILVGFILLTALLINLTGDAIVDIAGQAGEFIP